MTCLIGVSHRNVVREDVIVVRRAILALIDVVMKKGLRLSHTFFVCFGEIEVTHCYVRGTEELY